MTAEGSGHDGARSGLRIDLVTLAQARAHDGRPLCPAWVPAFAGMTAESSDHDGARSGLRIDLVTLAQARAHDGRPLCLAWVPAFAGMTAEGCGHDGEAPATTVIRRGRAEDGAMPSLPALLSDACCFIPVR